MPHFGTRVHLNGASLKFKHIRIGIGIDVGIFTGAFDAYSDGSV